MRDRSVGHMARSRACRLKVITAFAGGQVSPLLAVDCPGAVPWSGAGFSGALMTAVNITRMALVCVCVFVCLVALQGWPVGRCRRSVSVMGQ